MAGLFSKTKETKEGKYLVTRRDGTVPAWPYFVIGAADPNAPAALRAYAAAAQKNNMDPQYVADVRELADIFERWFLTHSPGDPDAPAHRTDDPATVARMKNARGA